MASLPLLQATHDAQRAHDQTLIGLVCENGAGDGLLIHVGIFQLRAGANTGRGFGAFFDDGFLEFWSGCSNSLFAALPLSLWALRR